MSENDDLIESITQELRRPVVASADARARLMDAVRASSRELKPDASWLRTESRGQGWLTRPRTFTVSPAGGLAMAAGLAAVVAGVTLVARPGPETVIAGGGPAAAAGVAGSTLAGTAARNALAGADAGRIVQFVLVAPAAARVSLVGDFNDWDTTATPLRQSVRGGVWTVDVPLSSGRHVYAFVVDGQRWVPDPNAPIAPSDDFGAPNSVIMVGEQT